jgi:hypothetical protein
LSPQGRSPANILRYLGAVARKSLVAVARYGEAFLQWPNGRNEVMELSFLVMELRISSYGTCVFSYGA